MTEPDRKPSGRQSAGCKALAVQRPAEKGSEELKDSTWSPAHKTHQYHLLFCLRGLLGYLSIT